MRADRLAVRGVPANHHERLFCFLIRQPHDGGQGKGSGAGGKEEVGGHIYLWYYVYIT